MPEASRAGRAARRPGEAAHLHRHRDTLEYLARNLRAWGYEVCTIHGGHPPATRKQIQHEFRTQRQICVATEAAGEGINLQFCHLMVDYDLPWNPVRLEQRRGRVHRIGQDSDFVVFNFCATNTVEGRLLERLHAKLDEMRSALQGRVYDVIGDLIAVNGVDFERLVKDTLANPRRERAALDEIDGLSPELLGAYERDIGIAQATRNVDLNWVRERDWRVRGAAATSSRSSSTPPSGSGCGSNGGGTASSAPSTCLSPSAPTPWKPSAGSVRRRRSTGSSPSARRSGSAQSTRTRSSARPATPVAERDAGSSPAP